MKARTKTTQLIHRRIRESIAVKRRLLRQSDLIARIAEAIVSAYRAGNKVILFGNGGSAADALHIAAELLGKYYLKRPSLPAIALSSNPCSLTAISNDFSFRQVFSLQLEAIGQSGDVAVGISTSGTSPNVLQALKVARRKGLVSVAFTGANVRKMKPLSDYCLAIASQDAARIQEAHILAGHVICEIVERTLFAG
jgi:D-sedoheptulose 7-phosphate isomerase